MCESVGKLSMVKLSRGRNAGNVKSRILYNSGSYNIGVYPTIETILSIIDTLSELTL